MGQGLHLDTKIVVSMKKIHVTKRQHKVEGNQIKYFNGEKWLVRETLKTKKKAEDRIKEMKDKDQAVV